MTAYAPLSDDIPLGDLLQVRRLVERAAMAQRRKLTAMTLRLAEIDKAILDCRARRVGKTA